MWNTWPVIGTYILRCKELFSCYSQIQILAKPGSDKGVGSYSTPPGHQDDHHCVYLMLTDPAPADLALNFGSGRPLVKRNE